MKHLWLKIVLPIACIFSFRMLGLFMLIPVFTLYAPQLTQATPLLIGLALGAYGLTQGLLQIPFGMLSDYFGRKPILIVGLVLLALGSVIGACSSSIYMMILARSLQGMGAIGSVLIALLGDITPEEHRTKGMAIIGLTIGLSFSLAMLFSPIIVESFQLKGIFYLTFFLAFLALFLVTFIIPTPEKSPFKAPYGTLKRFKSALSSPHLLRLNASIFMQHFILTSTFFIVPILLENQVAMGALSQSWHFYLPILFFSFIAMMPFIIVAERKQKMKGVLLLSVFALGISQFFLSIYGTSWLLFIGLLFIYFIFFNVLEACLPSLVSKQALINNRGTAMGIYSSCQFLGIFGGGIFAGLLYSVAGIASIFLANSILCVFWLMIIYKIQPQKYLSTIKINYPSDKEEESISQCLKKLPGVNDIGLMEDFIYLLVQKDLYQVGSAEKSLRK